MPSAPEDSPKADNLEAHSSDMLDMHMRSLPGSLAHRLPGLIGAIALFLVGSNYCLLSAWSGNTRMACMTVPRVGAAAATAGCHHCAPAGESSRPAGHNAGRSCCPAPVLAPSGPVVPNTLAAAQASPDVLAAIQNAPSYLSASAWRGRSVLPDGQPPTRHACAPLSPRAPPLA